METEGLLVQLEARIDRFEKSFERASRTADQRWREIENHGRRSSVTIEQGFARTASAVTTAATAASAAMLRMGAVIGVALSIKEVVQAADSWTKYGSQLAAAGVPVEKVGTTLNRLVDTALRTRTALEPTVDLFSKLTMVSDQYNLTADQAAKITETVSKAMKAGGASAQEQASAILQLSQAIGSGILAGDELRAIRESAPLLTKALATELKTTVGGLKELGEQGKLTGDVVLRALLNASTQIDAAFAKTIPTLSDGFNSVSTSFTAMVGEFDKGAGVTKKLAEALGTTSGNLKDLKSGAGGWGAILADEAAKALDKVAPLRDLIMDIAKNSAAGMLFQRLQGGAEGLTSEGGRFSEYQRGLAMLRRGMGTPLSTDLADLYGDSKGGIKAPPRDYGKKTGDLLESIQARTEALKVEIATFGQSTFAIEKAKTAQDLLSRAKAAEIPISDSLRARIDQASTAYAEQAVRLENLKTALQALDELKSSAKEFASGFAKDMANGVSGTEALTNALSRLQDKLIDLAASKLIDAALGGATGGLGGLLGNLIGGHAEGGLITGPGSGTSDSLVTRVSNGEYIVRASEASKHLDLLNLINSGQSLRVPDVGGQISVAAPTQNFAPVINIQSSGGTKDQNQDLADRMERKLRDMFTEMYSRETVRNMRHGGLLSK